MAAMAVVLLVAPPSLANAESLGSWTSTTNYSALNGVSCTAVSSEVYCVGGVGGGGSSHNQVDYATLGASGIGTWTSTTAYPTSIDSASCVNATGGIYCVGGEDGGTVLDDVYFALCVLFGSRDLDERGLVPELAGGDLLRRVLGIHLLRRGVRQQWGRD